MDSSRRGRVWGGFLTLALALGGFRALATEEPRLPDTAAGEIDGKAALSLSPAILQGGRLELIAPWGFEAHLTRQDDPGADLVFPCGVWFKPPVGRYRAWLEGQWYMSRHSSLLLYADRPFRDFGQSAVLPVFEAGRVTLPRHVIPDRQVFLRLLYAGSYLEGKLPRWEQRPTRPKDAGESDLDLMLRRGGTMLRPDLKVLTAERVYAIWYGLAPGSFELRAESKQGSLSPRRLTLASGEVGRIVEALVTWLSLDPMKAPPVDRRPRQH